MDHGKIHDHLPFLHGAESWVSQRVTVGSTWIIVIPSAHPTIRGIFAGNRPQDWSTFINIHLLN